VVLVLLAIAGSASATRADIVLRPVQDGTVSDTDLDGTGDTVGLGGAAVGHNHPGLPGENRAVYEYELGATKYIGRNYVYIDPVVTGGWGTDPDEPRLVVYVGRGDGVVTAEDFAVSDLEVAQAEWNMYKLGTTIDITDAVKRALPSRYLRVVIAPWTSPRSNMVWFLGSLSLEALYGEGYRTAHLLLSTQSPPERQIDGLIALVKSFDLPSPIQYRLIPGLVIARESIATGHIRLACYVLDGFINQVAKLKGNGLADWQADWLTTQNGGGPPAATDIKSTIGCR
jgi:hypothetical protein